MTLGKRIQALRKESALTQEQLAEMVGVSRQAVTKWETDQSVPSMEKLIMLSSIFEIPLGRLANGNAAQREEEIEPPATNARDSSILMANLTILATAFIGASSHGLYRWWYINSKTPVLVWLTLAFIGGVFLMVRDRIYYKKYHKQLIWYDLLFIIPTVCIPLIPMPYAASLTFIVAYAVTFMMVFIHKKIRPWVWKKGGGRK